MILNRDFLKDVFNAQHSGLSSAVLALVLLTNNAAVAQRDVGSEVSPYRLAQLIVEPGEMVQGEIPISPSADDSGTFIPVTVLHGSKPGPVLSLIAGIHGSEYSPILSMQQLPALLDPTQMSGTLIVVHIANMPAFTGRTVYFGPTDLKNLNRSFPGDSSGTITERIAYALTSHVIKPADYLIDIHSGDANESLRPSYSAYYAEAGGDDVVQQSKRIAVAFGLETVVQFAGSYDSIDDAIYTSAQAVTLGIPAMDVESGELGIIDDKYINPITKGVLNVMRELGMVQGQPDLPENPLFIADRARIYSEYDGIWYADPLVNTGDYVTQGTKLGVITDYLGRELETITAPVSGVLLILFGTPPVNEGDAIVVIGKLAEL
ncbi:MAG: succinylglutamate desuccinylase/aspartoacylase family protein [Gammaproteobacteria bacterium]|nr:succinylglutamate desuccinylase/aspartoacylase family protein [Gammaproteobacteria bacterium]MDG2338496.1 succinylglutamate desuccinylase/aspartoacylase family protein [Gammaproteobacteria bacterium]